MISPMRGFTLIEVIVTLSLLSILMLSMGGVMQTIAQTSERVDQRIDRVDEIRLAAHVLRQVLNRISGQKISPLGKTSPPIVQFKADATSIEWLGVMPARPGIGGRHFFRLQIETARGESNLVLRFLQWVPEQTKMNWSSAESRIIARNITKLQIQAQGYPRSGGAIPVGWPLGWVIGWPVDDALPERVKIQLSGLHGEWPEIVIPVYEMAQGQGVGADFVIGGDAR